MGETKNRHAGRPPKPMAAPPVQAVKNACALLRTFTVDRPVLTLTEMAGAASLHKSTCLRLAASLIEEGLMTRDEEGFFSVGSFAYFLGNVYGKTADLARLVTPELTRLAMESGESAGLYVREGQEQVLLLRVPSPQPVRDHLEIGARMPVHQEATGKVLCAFGEEAPSLSDYEREQLAKTRLRGFASSFGERNLQISSVAVPLWRVRGVLAGALSLSGPRTRLTRRLIPALSRLLIAAAGDLSVALGYDIRRRGGADA